MATLDFDRYAERIGYQGARTPTEDVLCGIHLAHATTVPFENLDIHLGVRIRLEPEHVFDKLVVRRRGGYCFEQNTLLLEMLRSIGFRVRPLAGRVTYGAQVVRPRTHMLLVLEVGGRPFLADVGFGTHNFLGALPFELDVEHTIHGEKFRVRQIAPSPESGMITHFAVDARVDEDEAWTNLYVFTLEEQHPVDFAMASWFTSTYPESVFVTTKIVSRPEIGRRFRLVDRELRTHDAGKIETRTIESDEAYRAVLRDTFGLELQ